MKLPLFNIFLLALLTTPLSFISLLALEEKILAKPTIPLSHNKDIKIVYHIGSPEMKHGVNKGLHYVSYVLDHYKRLGVPQNNLSIIAILYGDASTSLLNDPFYKQRHGRGKKNPNLPLIKKLINRGVKIELCGETARLRNMLAEEVPPFVGVNQGSFVRAIELQHQGYAYLKF